MPVGKFRADGAEHTSATRTPVSLWPTTGSFGAVGPTPPEQTVGELLAAAETAVAQDEFGAAAHHALGHAFAMTGQTDRMIGAFAAGVELNPSDAMANNCYGAHLAWVGRAEEAFEAVTRAMSISPRDPWAFE
ncbi:MAG: hypothetical protein BMS9Abin37_1607 [Acidobacteriota bacterium]|nr:MAG: hypothetical protein BMS9Abin37_1607 [Acidobacteriota bacterium]